MNAEKKREVEQLLKVESGLELNGSELEGKITNVDDFYDAYTSLSYIRVSEVSSMLIKIIRLEVRANDTFRALENLNFSSSEKDYGMDIIDEGFDVIIKSMKEEVVHMLNRIIG